MWKPLQLHGLTLPPDGVDFTGGSLSGSSQPICKSGAAQARLSRPRDGAKETVVANQSVTQRARSQCGIKVERFSRI